jgi:uncharacterized paraquat-inducible protein A
MRRNGVSCIRCGAPLRTRDIKVAGPFSCPACQARLQARESYAQWSFWGSMVTVTALLFIFGFRGLSLLYALLLAAIPTLYVEVNFLKYLIPPRIEDYLPEDATLRLRNGPHR